MKEFPRYRYDRNFLSYAGENVRNYLPELKSYIARLNEKKQPRRQVRVNDYSDTLSFQNTAELLTIPYESAITDSGTIISVYNYNPRDLILLGTGRGKQYVEYFLHPEPEIPAYTGAHDVILDIEGDTNSNYLFFMVKGKFQTFSCPINKWPHPSGNTSQQEMMTYADVEANPLIDRISDKDIYIKSGVLQTSVPVVIPKGYRVYFMAGTQIDLIEKAAFISYSPVFIKGSKDQPVVITSSDFSAQGFTVLQAGELSKLNYVRFENLNTLDFKGWTLTGAVTFYESDVEIRNVTFYRNQCEDALNTIRSDFMVVDSRFDYIFGDAFDSDFCTGIVDGTVFTNVGNDAIDFSGSQINIRNTVVDGASDKGISGGEESTLLVENTRILRSNIGFASKDLSRVKVVGSVAEDCEYGLVLLQKKPEYGDAVIELIDSKLLNCRSEMLIEKGSLVVRDGKTIEGTEEKLKAIFYQ